MKYCSKCSVHVRGSEDFCPLCQQELTGQKTPSPYPFIPAIFKQHPLFLRLLALSTAGATIICVIINLLLPQSGFWSVYVFLGILYFWLSLIIILREKQSLIKNIVMQTIVFSLFGLIFDLLTGWHGWSLNFFLPLSISVGLISTTLLVRIKKIPAANYLFYLIIIFIFSLIPLGLLIFQQITIPLPTYICLGLIILAFLELFLFHRENLFQELQKRFHL